MWYETRKGHWIDEDTGNMVLHRPIASEDHPAGWWAKMAGSGEIVGVGDTADAAKKLFES